ncbi:transposable element Tcb2 transposase [Trichonephila clavipes]|nr:transposable element Tcb2 transposase [Trichonephila clavipes]
MEFDKGTTDVRDEERAFSRWKVTDHFPYSPDLVPSDLHPCRPLKKHLGSQHFRSDAEALDESTFEILENKAQFVRRRRGEKFHSDCVVQTVKHPKKIMIWSVISGKGTGHLYVVKGMMRQDQCKDVLKNRLIPQLEKWRTIHFYARWNSLPYSSVYQSCFGRTKYPLLDWPGNSLDMNTIENVWEFMKREVDKDVITNKTQLLERIIQVWNHRPQMQETVQSCIDSMPRIIEALIAAKGGTTKYLYLIIFVPVFFHESIKTYFFL